MPATRLHPGSKDTAGATTNSQYSRTWDPFYRWDVPLSWLQSARFLVCMFTLVPCRFVLFLCAVVFAWTVLHLLDCVPFCCLSERPKFRFARVILAWTAWFMLQVSGFWCCCVRRHTISASHMEQWEEDLSLETGPSQVDNDDETSTVDHPWDNPSVGEDGPSVRDARPHVLPWQPPATLQRIMCAPSDSVPERPASAGRWSSGNVCCPTLIANHVSWVDILLLMAYSECPAFVAKASIAEVPFVGYIAKWMSGVFVGRDKHVGGVLHDSSTEPRRGGQAEEHKSVRGVQAERRGGSISHSSSTARIMHHQHEWHREAQADEDGGESRRPRVAIFPEGATTNGRYLICFHRGAFASGLPVQGCLLHYSWKRFNPAWETYFFPLHLLVTLCQVYNSADWIQLPVYNPTPQEQRLPELYASHMRHVMAKVLQVSLREARHSSKREYHEWIWEHDLKKHCSGYFRTPLAYWRWMFQQTRRC